MAEQVLTQSGAGAGAGAQQRSTLTEAYAYGLAGVLMFSGGIVATRMAVLELPPVFVGAGRAAVAGVLSLFLLWAMQQKIPARRFWPGLLIVAFGAAFAFPVFTALALQWTDAGHATLVTTLMPLFTAIFGAWLSRQIPKVGFWCFTCCGAALVLSHSLAQHQVSTLALADGLMLLACLFCGLAYAKGAMLAKELGSWQVICWALVLVLPVLLPWTLWQVPAITFTKVSASAWLGFAYLSVFSMFLGFFAWYRGLSLGGVAQISQLQQLSPFLGLGWAALCLGEHITLTQLGLAALVVLCIVLGRRFG